MALPMMKASMKKSTPMKGAPMKGAAMKGAAMKKVMKAKKVSKIARGSRAKSSVFSGRKEKTTGDLTKESLMKNKLGKVVSKKASARSKKAYANSGFKVWVDAVKAARK